MQETKTKARYEEMTKSKYFSLHDESKFYIHKPIYF